MGKTAFSGPVYGAKALLWSFSRSSTTVESTVSQVYAELIVPAGQDWLITDIHAYRNSTHSTNLVITVKDNSSRATASSRTIGDVAITSSAAGGVLGSTVISADAGEYEGRRVASLSTLGMGIANGGSSVTGFTGSVWVYGYPRFASSTRSE